MDQLKSALKLTKSQLAIVLQLRQDEEEEEDIISDAVAALRKRHAQLHQAIHDFIYQLTPHEGMIILDDKQRLLVRELSDHVELMKLQQNPTTNAQLEQLVESTLDLFCGDSISTQLQEPWIPEMNDSDSGECIFLPLSSLMSNLINNVNPSAIDLHHVHPIWSALESQNILSSKESASHHAN